MSRAGSIVPGRNAPVPLKATRVPPGPVVVSTFVRAEPGDGLVTTAIERLGAVGAGSAGARGASTLGEAALGAGEAMTGR